MKTLSVICTAQKAYGKEVNIADVYAYFEMKFQGRYSVDQIIYALGIYTDRKSDIPTPADIFNILNPPAPRISEAAFVEAQKYQERNNWPIMSDAQDVIDAYRKQERGERGHFDIENKRLLEIAGKAVNRIGG